MSNDVMMLSQDAEEVLREIAGDPHSVLLRVPREQVTRGLFEDTSPFGSMTAGLSSAERELVRTHRDEVAYLLRLACWIQITKRSEERIFNYEYHTPDALKDADELARSWNRRALERAPDAIEAQADSSIMRAGRLLLEACTPFERPEWASIDELASASHRLVPRDETRIYAAQTMPFRGMARAAISIYRRVLEGAPLADVKTLAWTNGGFCYDVLGEYERAVDARTHALLVDRTHVINAVQLLHSALRTGAVVEMHLASDLLNQLTELDQARALAEARGIRERRRTSFWRGLKQVGVEPVMRPSGLSPVAVRIVDELLV